MRSLFSFPDPVNDVAARLVAGGVILLSLAAIALDQPWLLLVIAYGFVARVASGPKFEPLAQLVLRVVIPLFKLPERPTPGPPKRFAQAIGASLSLTAVVLHFGFDLTGAAYVAVGMIMAAASLEAFAGFCLGCWLFARLIRMGVLPASLCPECADITRRPRVVA